MLPEIALVTNTLLLKHQLSKIKYTRQALPGMIKGWQDDNQVKCYQTLHIWYLTYTNIYLRIMIKWPLVTTDMCVHVNKSRAKYQIGIFWIPVPELLSLMWVLCDTEKFRRSTLSLHIKWNHSSYIKPPLKRHTNFLTVHVTPLTTAGPVYLKTQSSKMVQSLTELLWPYHVYFYSEWRSFHSVKHK